MKLMLHFMVRGQVIQFIQRISRCLLALACLVSANAFAVNVGERAPDFERMPLKGGQPISLKNYQGKVVYLDFWASWCGPCRDSMPLMNRMYEELSGQGFVVLAVNLDAYVDEALDFIKRQPVSYPIVRDTGGLLPELYGMQGMPTAYLIDRSGRVRYVHHGFRKGDAGPIREAVVTLLKEGR